MPNPPASERSIGVLPPSQVVRKGTVKKREGDQHTPLYYYICEWFSEVAEKKEMKEKGRKCLLSCPHREKKKRISFLSFSGGKIELILHQPMSDEVGGGGGEKIYNFTN